jgi:hypothetical protein
MNGRIRSIEAPVVPTRLASTAPAARMSVLAIGRPRPRMSTRIEPETMYSPPTRAMKE